MITAFISVYQSPSELSVCHLGFSTREVSLEQGKHSRRKDIFLGHLTGKQQTLFKP